MNIIQKMLAWLHVSGRRSTLVEAEPIPFIHPVAPPEERLQSSKVTFGQPNRRAKHLQTSIEIDPAPKRSIAAATKRRKKSPAPVHRRERQPSHVRPHIAKLADGLDRRSWKELQQTWLNLVSQSERDCSPDLGWFKQKLLDEWSRRGRIALSSPNNPEYFAWPSTDATYRGGQTSAGSFRAEGMLAYLGYHVGVTNGLSCTARRFILDTVFTGTLPPVDSAEYVRSWGKPNTSTRLRRLAQELARFARNGKVRQSANLSVAVGDWKEDLDYLKNKYYRSRFQYSPASSVFTR